jgi:hypothetical protein
VLAAFRLGLCVSEVRDRIEPQEDSPMAWSVLIPSLERDTTVPILKQYNEVNPIYDFAPIY